MKDKGDVYSWGWNAYGSLGIGTKVDHNLPQLITSLKDIVSIKCGNVHFVALGSK